MKSSIAVSCCSLLLLLGSRVPSPAVTVSSSDDLIFIHHSCGANWLADSLDAALTAKDYIDERNDAYYGTDLAPVAGRPDSLGPAPGDHTNMDHWICWFNDYLGTVKTLGCANGVNRIIMFKSCFPISGVSADGTEPGDPFSASQTIANYKAVYRHPDGTGHTYGDGGYQYKALEEIFAENPDTLFIAVTAPPLYFNSTSDADAHRARLFNNWLKNDWLAGYNTAHPGLDNVAVFDWFNVLANADDATANPNRLKDIYVASGGDSHPNSAANSASTALFCTNPDNFLGRAWQAFISSTTDSTTDDTTDGTTDGTTHSPSRTVIAYPNPYIPSSGGAYGRAGGILFENLSANARIAIYTIAGELVYETEKRNAESHVSWGAVNNAGNKVASGVYIYVITNLDNSGDVAKGKVVVIR